MPKMSIIFFEVDIIRFNLFSIEYLQGKARQGKARQGKARQGNRQKYSINLNHNGNIITLIKFLSIGYIHFFKEFIIYPTTSAL